MAKEKSPKTSGKKQVRNDVMQKLSTALAVYKQELGEKKFQNRIKEASKLFSRNLKAKAKKEQQPRAKLANADNVALHQNPEAATM